MTFDHAKQYLARVVAWPQANEVPSWINVHWTFVPKAGVPPHGKLPWTGRAVQSVADAVRALDWVSKLPDTRDIYVCMSAQREAEQKVSQKGYPYFKPIRNQANAVALKSLFIDIDFKGGEHGYNNGTEAIEALAAFVKLTGLPGPTLVVASGGGIHVYWTLMRALTPAEWQPLANALAEATKRNGLKCDTQCTIDAARVLRIPDTFNHKTTPPRGVRIVGTPKDFDYSVERLALVLAPYINTTTPSQHCPLPQLTPITGDDDLSAGITSNKIGPIDVTTVVNECAFIRDALTTGGKDYTNPLWNLTTLLATFMVDGRDQAHAMGNQHPGYSKESTDEFFDRKSKERDEKGLGWPSCQTISATGCKACQTCPHFAAGKSPLNFGFQQVAVQQPSPQAMAVIAGTPQDLPEGFTRLPTGQIAAYIENADGSKSAVPLCKYPMTDPWLQRCSQQGLILNFTATIENKKDSQISIPAGSINGMTMRTLLQQQGLMVTRGAPAINAMGDLLVGWITKLQETRESVQSAPFGWDVKNGKIEGFVYGGHLWTPTGSKPAVSADAEIGRQYAPTGDPAKWDAAARMVIDQKRPALDAILASAWGAPLMRFTGQPGVVMSAYSTETGLGKTTALVTALAMWGNPIAAKNGLIDTKNSIIAKLSELRALPVYWDEIKSDEQMIKFTETLFEVTGGKGKARLGRNIKQREVGTWQTMLLVCTNQSVLDYVLNNTNTTEAGLVRVLEYAVPMYDPNGPGRIEGSKADVILSSLNDNYGHVGLEYAKWLGTNFAQVEKDMEVLRSDLDKEFDAKTDERFWMALVAALILGARYANQLRGCGFDEPALKAFLRQVIEDSRTNRSTQTVNLAQDINISSLMADYLGATRMRNTVITNTIHINTGKPPAGAIKILSPTGQLQSIHVHVGRDDKLLRISNTHFRDWLNSKSYSRTAVFKELAKLGLRHVKGRLASGTELAGATEYLLQIDLSGTPMLNFIDEA